MNLASCVDDWSSTRTAGKLLAGTKRLHLAPRQNRRPSNTERVLEWPPTPTRTAARPHADSAMPLRQRGSAPPRRGPARGNPIPIPHRSTPGRACSGDCATFRKTLGGAERGIAQRQISRKLPRL
jgi:hypothetical protein